jgi:hypothetical protein
MQPDIQDLKYEKNQLMRKDEVVLWAMVVASNMRQVSQSLRHLRISLWLYYQACFLRYFPRG